MENTKNVGKIDLLQSLLGRNTKAWIAPKVELGVKADDGMEFKINQNLIIDEGEADQISRACKDCHMTLACAGEKARKLFPIYDDSTSGASICRQCYLIRAKVLKKEEWLPFLDKPFKEMGYSFKQNWVCCSPNIDGLGIISDWKKCESQMSEDIELKIRDQYCGYYEPESQFALCTNCMCKWKSLNLEPHSSYTVSRPTKQIASLRSFDEELKI